MTDTVWSSVSHMVLRVPPKVITELHKKNETAFRLTDKTEELGNVVLEATLTLEIIHTRLWR